MQTLTQQIVSNLDVLFGLYQLALDYAKKISPEEEEEALKWIGYRAKILDRTEHVSREAAAMLREFDALRNVPAAERALVEEKRNLIQDLSFKMNHVDNLLLRNLQTRLADVRQELAVQNHRKDAIKAYIRAPGVTFAVS